MQVHLRSTQSDWQSKTLAALLAFAFAVSPAVLRAQDPATPAPATPAQAPPAAAAPSAGNGKWKEIAVPEALAKRGSPEKAALQRGLADALRATTLDDNARRTLEGYFVQIGFAEMTQVANVTRLTDARQNFRNRYLRSPFTSEPAHTYLNELVFQNMSKIAHDNGFHPAVRVNAMLMIADLNQKEAAVAAGVQTPAVPLPAALSQRGGLLDSAEDTTLHPAVRAMALYGIQRHADANLPAASQPAVLTKMAAVLKEKSTDPANAQALAWLKARAAGVLATMGAADPTGAVPGELATIIIDATSPVDLRCAAAKALGSQKGLAAGMVKLPEVVPALGNLHLDACRAEIDRAAFEQDTVAPRQVHARASAVQAALGDGKAGGVAALIPAGDAQKALADAISKNVAETLALVPDENADPTEQLKLKADELEKILADAKVLKSQPRATAAAAAAEAAPAADTNASAAKAK